MKTLTISVAAYNVSKYLNKLCQSIIDSDYLEEIELLIVDDGSKDDTAKIAQGYEAKYPNSICYVAKKNGGHGSTINKGIEVATGKYFKVLDGDDWFDTTGLNKLMDTLCHTDCDLFVTDRKRVFEDTGIEIIDSPQGIPLNQICVVDDICVQMSRLLFHSVFVRTSILKDNNVHIDEHCFYVDNEILWYPFPYINTIYYVDTVVYCYRLGLADQSVNTKVIAKRFDQHEFVSLQMLNFYTQVINDFSESRKIYFNRVMANNVEWHFETLLLLPFMINNWRKVIEYRNIVREKAPAIIPYFNAEAVSLLTRSPILFYPIVWMKKRKIRGAK